MIECGQLLAWYFLVPRLQHHQQILDIFHQYPQVARIMVRDLQVLRRYSSLRHEHRAHARTSTLKHTHPMLSGRGGNLEPYDE